MPAHIPATGCAHAACGLMLHLEDTERARDCAQALKTEPRTCPPMHLQHNTSLRRPAPLLHPAPGCTAQLGQHQLRPACAVQDVDEKDLAARRANDTHFAGQHPQIQAAILLVEQFSETLHQYGEFMGHPHRSVSPECAHLTCSGLCPFPACSMPLRGIPQPHPPPHRP